MYSFPSQEISCFLPSSWELGEMKIVFFSFFVWVAEVCNFVFWEQNQSVRVCAIFSSKTPITLDKYRYFSRIKVVSVNRKKTDANFSVNCKNEIRSMVHLQLPCGNHGFSSTSVCRSYVVEKIEKNEMKNCLIKLF